MQEDEWNKWEYDPKTKKLEKDKLNSEDDSKQVKKFLDGWFKNKDLLFLINLYGRNSGYMNSGDRNSGDRNSGYMNSGDMNSTYGSNGVFCTQEQKILIFNKPSEMTLREWRDRKFGRLFNNFSPTEWIAEDKMTVKEKKDNPNFYVAQGYLKKILYNEACKNWWKLLNAKDKKEVQTIPNFDKKVFKEITGIAV